MEWSLLTIRSAIDLPMASTSSFHPSLALCLTALFLFASGSRFICLVELKKNVVHDLSVRLETVLGRSRGL